MLLLHHYLLFINEIENLPRKVRRWSRDPFCHDTEAIQLATALAIAAYYVLNDNIYQGPTLFTVLNERIVSLGPLQF